MHISDITWSFGEVIGTEHPSNSAREGLGAPRIPPSPIEPRAGRLGIAIRESGATTPSSPVIFGHSPLLSIRGLRIRDGTVTYLGTNGRGGSMGIKNVIEVQFILYSIGMFLCGVLVGYGIGLLTLRGDVGSDSGNFVDWRYVFSRVPYYMIWVLFGFVLGLLVFSK